MVVWRDERNGKGDIYAQRYSISGVKQGVNFRVNDDSGSNWQDYPAIAVDISGNVVVAWIDYRNGNYDIYVQRYNSSGVKLGTNFRVNDDSGNSAQWNSTIAVDVSGNVVVAWIDERNGNYDIYAQRYSSGGVKQGANFRVNDDSGSNWQWFPGIAADNSGNFVVVWSDNRNGDWDIYCQRYSSGGVKQGANFRINDDSGSRGQDYPAITVDGSGNFVVVWWDKRNGDDDIYAQRYNSSGVAQGSNFRVNDDNGSSDQRRPAIAADGSGNVVMVWHDFRENRNSLDIYAQLFDSQGQKIGSNYRVNNDTGTKDQCYPDVKLVNGHIYYTWQDNRIEGQGWNIFARVDRFNFAPKAPGLSFPENNSIITTDKPALTFTVPVDDNNDLLHFNVEISQNSSFTSHITGSPFESKNNSSGFSQTPPLPSGTGTCSFTVPTALTNGDYWWRVSAWDGTAYGSASEQWKFTVSVTPVYLQPVVNDHSLHQEFYVDIQIKDAQNLFGVAFKLNFPADKLEALSAEKGDFLGTDPVFFPDINNSAGVVSVGVSKKSGQPAANGAGIVARIKLKEKPSVTSGISIELSLTEVAANDPSGNAITLTPQNTSYVTPGASATLDVSPASLTLGSATNSQGSFSITSNVSWSVSDNAPWLDVSPSSGSGNGTITVTSNSANSSASSRNATVTVSGGGISRTVEVTQSGSVQTGANITSVVQNHSLHQEFYVDIQIKDARNLFGVAFKLNFPADKLEALSAEKGDFLGTDPVFFPDINNSAGVVSVGVSKKSGQPAANGTGIVARIKLKEKPSVTSGITIELSLTEVAANDPSGNAITLTPQNTSYVTPNPTSVAETNKEVPDNYVLYPNYPNPFNPTTTISYALPTAAQVRIHVFDLTGRLVKTLLDAEQQPGIHSIAWDARDDAGKEVANGMYICRMMAGGEVLHQKMILAK